MSSPKVKPQEPKFSHKRELPVNDIWEFDFISGVVAAGEFSQIETQQQLCYEQTGVWKPLALVAYELGSLTNNQVDELFELRREEGSRELLKLESGSFRDGLRRPEFEVERLLETCYVPGETFIVEGSMVSKLVKDSLSGEIEVGHFYADKFPVTNLQYALYCLETGTPRPPSWAGTLPKSDVLFHPVVFVSLEDAQNYARWAGKRIPNVVEWLHLAGMSDGRIYPWGKDFNFDCCQANHSEHFGLVSVGNYPRGANQFGIEDLAGNCYEWTTTGIQTDYFGQSSPKYYIIKGGSYLAGPIDLTIEHYSKALISTKESHLGFRCISEAKPDASYDQTKIAALKKLFLEHVR
ncbi:MAG: formylglycine-generating enzyme family protein [Planctomycetes bacterium]|nr:formylglycine-generating enzyme family protein [Planctomycetota bacterium]